MSSPQRKRLIKEFAYYFAEKGYIPSMQEVFEDKNRPQRVRLSDFKRIFSSWDMMIRGVKTDYKDLIQFTKPSAVDDAADVMSTPDPLATLRASTTEK